MEVVIDETREHLGNTWRSVGGTCRYRYIDKSWDGKINMLNINVDTIYEEAKLTFDHSMY